MALEAAAQGGTSLLERVSQAVLETHMAEGNRMNAEQNNILAIKALS